MSTDRVSFTACGFGLHEVIKQINLADVSLDLCQQTHDDEVKLYSNCCIYKHRINSFLIQSIIMSLVLLKLHPLISVTCLSSESMCSSCLTQILAPFQHSLLSSKHCSKHLTQFNRLTATFVECQRVGGSEDSWHCMTNLCMRDVKKSCYLDRAISVESKVWRWYLVRWQDW